MPSTTRACARSRSLFDLINARLSPAAQARLAVIFAAYEVGAPAGPRYRVGSVMRQAWEAEDGIPEALADRVADLLTHLLEVGDISSYPNPTCCDHHRLLARVTFPHRTAYPGDDELLGLAIKLIWTLLPQLRGILDMQAPRPRKVRMFRFMVLENFLDRHHREVMSRALPRVDAAKIFQREFGASRPAALRHSELQSRLRNREIVGLLGARVDVPPGGTTRPHYCPDCWVFSTPGLLTDTDRSGTPDPMLAKLGLEFEAGKTYIELVYDVHLEASPPLPTAHPRPMAPTVIDSVGYWLFKPHRSNTRAGRTKWNYTRDIAIDDRGCRELVSPVIPVHRLTDLVIWPRSTAANWATSATPSLGTALKVP